MLKRLSVFLVTAAMVGTITTGCGGNNGSSIASFVQSVIFFVSARKAPNNTEGDGDIFKVSLSSPGSLTNLTDNGTATGDDEDVACASDATFGRSRIFFVSERTDIGNTAGDVDIFGVSHFGGTISNVTDQTSGTTGDADDVCLGLTSGGDVVFESGRTDTGDNAAADVDIFVATITVGTTGAMTSSLSNRTAESTTGTFTNRPDRLVHIAASTLIFESDRRENDDTSGGNLPNAHDDRHIFSVTQSGTKTILNLTHDGDIQPAANGTFNVDRFCGISGNNLLFQSSRQQGVDANSRQLVADQDVFLRNLGTNQTLTGGVNSAIANLTDAGTGTAAVPGDSADICLFGSGFNAITSAGGTAVGIFVSSRTAAGTHRTNSTGGFTTFSALTNPPAQGDSGDIFQTTLSITASNNVLNTVTNLTDGASGTSNAAADGDEVDTFLGTCGTRLLFASRRTDRASTSTGTEDDIYSVDLSSSSHPIVNLTDNTSSGGTGDANDVFLCCNSLNNRIAFASSRTDVTNANSDVDIFTTSVGTSSGTITNLTETTSGDADDAFDAVASSFEAKSQTGSLANAGGFFGQTTGFTNSLANVPAAGLDNTGFGANFNNRSAYNGFSVGCINNNDFLVWVSNRTNPSNNSSTDFDIFVSPFLSLGNVCTVANNCLTNMTNASSDDSNDFITALDGYTMPLTIQ